MSSDAKVGASRPKVVVWLTAGGILEFAADPGVDLELVDFQNLEAGDCREASTQDWDAWLEANAPALREDLRRYEPRYECQNCDTPFWTDEALVRPVPDLEQRVVAGEPMPPGECPHCGALVAVLKGSP